MDTTSGNRKLSRRVKEKHYSEETQFFQVNSFKVEGREEGDANEDVPCGFCGVKWGQSHSSGDWIQCQMCGKWYHELCVGARAVVCWYFGFLFYLCLLKWSLVLL
jgi:hypothetical protein